MAYLGPKPSDGPLTETQIQAAGDSRYLTGKAAQSFLGSETDQARKNIAVSRNYSGATTATNGINFSSTESGRFYTMNLSAGVNTGNLPNTSVDGFEVVIVATGDPSGWNVCYITALGAKNITYRNVTANTFALVGQGEVFRFTWLASLNLWIAECLVQPGRIYLSKTLTGSGSWNSGATSHLPVSHTTRSGAAAFANSSTNSGYYVRIPAIGVYHFTSSVLIGTTANASSLGGSAYIYGNGVPGAALYNHVYFTPYSTAPAQQIMSISTTAVLNNTNEIGATHLVSSSTLWYYPDSNTSYIEMLSR